MKRALVVVVGALVVGALAAILPAAKVMKRHTHADRAASAFTSPADASAMKAEEASSALPPPRSVEASPGTRMIHGDARHTHQAAGYAPRTTPSVKWSRDVGGPIEAEVTTSRDERQLYVATLNGKLMALATEDGAIDWSLDLEDRIYSTPCVTPDGAVVVGIDGGKVVAVSSSGKIEWSLRTEGDADTGPAFVDDGAIVFAAGSMVYAVTPRGYVKWRFAAKRKVFTSPAIDDHGRVFFGSQDHHAYALGSDGGLLWSVDLGADVDGAPAVGPNESVFFGTDGDEVIRLGADGHVLWRSNVGGFVRGTLSVARNGDVLAGVYGPMPRQVRLRAADGAIGAAFSIQGTGAREFGVHGGSLEDAAGVLLFGAQDDNVYAITPSGKLLWRFTTGGDVDAPVTLLGDGSVVVGSDDGRVTRLGAVSP